MNIFIGCSSRETISKCYQECAIELGNYLAKNNYNLICGGIDGMMNLLKTIFLENNRTVFLKGVNHYFKIDESISNSSNYDSVNERKKEILNQADMAIFLPGGIGTIDEIFTAIESKRAKEHNLPIIIVNINHYYDGIIKQLDTMYQEQFASLSDEKYYKITNNIKDTIKYIQELGEKDER